jgi:hypothetical protein
VSHHEQVCPRASGRTIIRTSVVRANGLRASWRMALLSTGMAGAAAGELTTWEATVAGAAGRLESQVFSSSRFQVRGEAPSRDRRTEVRERSCTCDPFVSGSSHWGDVGVLDGSRGCLSQRIVVGRARAPQAQRSGREEAGMERGARRCENSLIQPRMVYSRRLRRHVKWGIPTAGVLTTGG